MRSRKFPVSTGICYNFLLILITATVYRITLVPGISNWIDSVKFQYIGKVLGIPHSTGYPLYIYLNWLFTNIPLGSTAVRANLMSLVFAVLTVVVLYQIIILVVKNELAAFYFSLFFAFGPTFWSQAIKAEVYTLNSFLFALVLWLLIKWHNSKKIKYLQIFLIVYPISFGNHLTMITVFPAILLFIILTDPWVFQRLKLYISGFIGLVLGLGLYFSLFLLSRYSVYTEESINNFGDLVKVATGHPFRSKMFVDSIGKFISGQIPFFWHSLEENLLAAGIVLALLGLFFLARENLKIWWLLVLAASAEAVFALNFVILESKVYLIPVFLILCLFSALGLRSIIDLVTVRWMRMVIFGFLAANLAWFAATNFSKIDHSKTTRLDKRLTACLKALPEGSVIFSSGVLDRELVNYKRFTEFTNKSLFFIRIRKREPEFAAVLNYEIYKIARLVQIPVEHLMENTYIITDQTFRIGQKHQLCMQLKNVGDEPLNFYYKINLAGQKCSGKGVKK